MVMKPVVDRGTVKYGEGCPVLGRRGMKAIDPGITMVSKVGPPPFF